VASTAHDEVTTTAAFEAWRDEGTPVADTFAAVGTRTNPNNLPHQSGQPHAAGVAIET
jgi:hypothetical protein